ncbi:MAG: MFS transporter [Alphaproteobacteria bacterium]
MAKFYGWRIVGAAFVLAFFGWGLGFYGPPVYLHAVREARGFSLGVVSSAVTVHYLAGAIVVANVPALYRRFGLPAVTIAAAILLSAGVAGWAIASEPWQLFAATLVSGAGWAAMGAVPVNTAVAPWFVRARPAALGTAYNGASFAGLIFSPLWVVAISALGFPVAAAIIGAATIVTVAALASHYFARTPQQMGLEPDGDAVGTPVNVTAPHARPLPGPALWRDFAFITLATGSALSLFAQIGLITHLYSLLVPALGTQWAGLVMGIGAGAGMGGRMLVAWLMPAGADRRRIACVSYAVQIVGTLLLIAAGGANIPLLLVGVLLFGVGIGNVTSMPPLIAQVEFVKDDVPRVVALVVAIGQATYAFAPAAFGFIRELAGASTVFAVAALIYVSAIGALLIGRYGAMKSARAYP